MKKKYKLLLSKTAKEWYQEADEEMEIDIYDLHHECAHQPSRYIKWAKLSSVARVYRKECEANLERTRAKFELKIRQNPEKFNLKPDSKGKIMEGAYKAKLNLIPEVKQAQKEYFKAYELRNLFYDIVKGFNQRLFMLQEEVVLWKNEYYSDVRTDDESGVIGANRNKNKED